MTTGINQVQERVRSNFKRAKLLLIDDDSDEQWVIMKKAMQQALPEVSLVPVATAEEASQLLSEWSTQEWELPKLIMLDLYLPTREDGWQLLRRIKAMSEPCSRIPIVALGALADMADIEATYQYGVSSYVVKPIGFDGWLTYLRELRTYWWETVTLPPVQFSL